MAPHLPFRQGTVTFPFKNNPERTACACLSHAYHLHCIAALYHVANLQVYVLLYSGAEQLRFLVDVLPVAHTWFLNPAESLSLLHFHAQPLLHTCTLPCCLDSGLCRYDTVATGQAHLASLCSASLPAMQVCCFLQSARHCRVGSCIWQADC